MPTDALTPTTITPRAISPPPSPCSCHPHCHRHTYSHSHQSSHTYSQHPLATTTYIYHHHSHQHEKKSNCKQLHTTSKCPFQQAFLECLCAKFRMFAMWIICGRYFNNLNYLLQKQFIYIIYNLENKDKQKKNSKILRNYLPYYLHEYPFLFLSI